MKYIGVTALIISTTGAGLYLRSTAMKRVKICRALVTLCDIICVDISYRRTPLPELIGTGCSGVLSFITPEAVMKKSELRSCLNESDNAQISDFLFMLGKSDAHSQLKLIESFRSYSEGALKRYSEEYSKNSKLYVSIGVFGGLVLALIMI